MQKIPDFQIVSPLVSKLSWTHFLLVMPLKDELQREFYLTMAANERWSKRTLQAKIDGMLFERTAIATKPEELIKQELAYEAGEVEKLAAKPLHNPVINRCLTQKRIV